MTRKLSKAQAAVVRLMESRDRIWWGLVPEAERVPVADLDIPF